MSNFNQDARIDLLLKNLFNRVGISTSFSVASESRATIPVYDSSRIWTDALSLNLVNFPQSFSPEPGRYYTIDENNNYTIVSLQTPPDLSFPTEVILLYREFIIKRVSLAVSYYRDFYDDSSFDSETSYNIYSGHSYPGVFLRDLVNPFIFSKFSNYTSFQYNISSSSVLTLGPTNDYILKDGCLIIFTGLNIPSGSDTSKVRVRGFQYLARFGGGSGSSVSRVITVDNDFSILPSYGTVLVSNSNSSVTITLPSANATRGRTIRVMKVSNSVHPVYVQVNESNLRILNSIDDISGIDTITTSRRYVLRQQFECAEFFNVSLNPPVQNIAWVVTSIL